MSVMPSFSYILSRWVYFTSRLNYDLKRNVFSLDVFYYYLRHFDSLSRIKIYMRWDVLLNFMFYSNSYRRMGRLVVVVAVRCRWNASAETQVYDRRSRSRTRPGIVSGA